MSMKSTPNIWWAIDFETDGPNKYTTQIDRACMCGFSQNTILQPEFHPDLSDTGRELYLDDLRRAATSGSPIVMHNAEFDLYLLERRLGIKVRGPIYDTMLMAKHWHNLLPSYSLKSLAWLLFGDVYSPLIKLRQWLIDNADSTTGEDDGDFDMTKPPDELVHEYCTHDVVMTARIAQKLWPLVKDNYAFQQDSEITRLQIDMEANGMYADLDFYRDYRRRGRRRVRYNRKEAAKHMGVEGNPMGNALREHLGKLGEGRRTRTGMVKSDDVVLRDWSDPAIDHVQRVRGDEKEIHTYIDNIVAVAVPTKADPSIGVFHPNFLHSGATTRRFKSRNLYSDSGAIAKGQVQNFPRGEGIRSGIVVPKGWAFVKLDLASIEARLGAHAMALFCNYHWFCEQYRKSDTFNIYLHVARDVEQDPDITKKHPIYQAYKHGCLGVQYGVGLKTFYVTLHDKFQLPYTMADCERIYRRIRGRYPQFSRLQRAVSSIVDTQGFVKDDFGAIYYIPKGESYKAVNAYCQGCAGNILRWWWIELDKIRGKEDWIFNIVHDEFDMAVKRDRQAKSRVRSYCEVLGTLDIFELSIVAEASDLCNNWGEAG